jgi:hypothetical protein
MSPGKCALLALLLVADAAGAAQAVSQPSLKAAFLYNFAKFAEWPVDAAAGGPLTLCVLADDASEDALVKLVNGASVNGRAVTVSRSAPKTKVRTCHLLYIAEPDADTIAGILEEVKGAPVLTVGDGDAFARRGGIVGLVIEDGRMRFAINPDAAQRSGVRLSSKLLSLAKLVRD